MFCERYKTGGYDQHVCGYLNQLVCRTRANRRGVASDLYIVFFSLSLKYKYTQGCSAKLHSTNSVQSLDIFVRTI